MLKAHYETWIWGKTETTRTLIGCISFTWTKRLVHQLMILPSVFETIQHNFIQTCTTSTVCLAPKQRQHASYCWHQLHHLDPGKFIQSSSTSKTRRCCDVMSASLATAQRNNIPEETNMLLQQTHQRQSAPHVHAGCLKQTQAEGHRLQRAFNYKVKPHKITALLHPTVWFHWTQKFPKTT